VTDESTAGGGDSDASLSDLLKSMSSDETSGDSSSDSSGDESTGGGDSAAGDDDGMDPDLAKLLADL
jgi:hypothetical protein